jgi:hypothetical protein
VSTHPAAVGVIAKVPATMEVKAAMTMVQNSQLNSRNRRRPVLPMYFSIQLTKDLPLFLTSVQGREVMHGAKEDAADEDPHSSTGTQPKAMATMVPWTGPAPQMEENW